MPRPVSLVLLRITNVDYRRRRVECREVKAEQYAKRDGTFTPIAASTRPFGPVFALPFYLFTARSYVAFAPASGQVVCVTRRELKDRRK